MRPSVPLERTMRTFRSLLLLALCAAPAFGQTTKHGSISAADSSCIERACTSLQLTNDVGTVTVQLSGTWSATLKPEKTVDGTNWVSAGADLTANGITSYGLAAHTGFRVRASAYVSGVVQLDLKQSANAGSGATPGGADGDLQVNSGGLLGGIAPGADGEYLASLLGAWVVTIPGLEARTDADGTAALLNTDRAKQVSVSNAGANAVSIAQAGTGTPPLDFGAGYFSRLCQAVGAGTVTLTATTSTFDVTGATSLVFNTPGGCVQPLSNGSNYLVPQPAWIQGVRQTFAPNSTNAGLNVGSVAGDPSAPVNGDMWYDSTSNELTGRINGINIPLGVQYLTRPGGITTAVKGWPGLAQITIEDWTDGGAVCSSSAAAQGQCGTGMTWWLTGGGGTAVMNTATGIGNVNHPGLRRIQTGTTATNQAELQTTAAAAGSMPWSSFFDVIWVFNGVQTDANTKHRIGLSNDAGGDPPTDGVYLERLTTDTNWFMVVMASSSPTRHDTGIAHGTGWFTSRFRRISSTTVGMTLCSGDGCTLSAEVTFCASGCTVTSANVPTGTGDADARLIAFVETATNAAKALMIDYVDRIITGIVR